MTILLACSRCIVVIFVRTHAHLLHSHTACQRSSCLNGFVKPKCDRLFIVSSQASSYPTSHISSPNSSRSALSTPNTELLSQSKTQHFHTTLQALRETETFHRLAICKLRLLQCLSPTSSLLIKPRNCDLSCSQLSASLDNSIVPSRACSAQGRMSRNG